MIPFQTHLIVGAVCLATGFASGWRTNSWKNAADREAEMRGAALALEATAKELAKLDVKQVTIKQEVQKHVIEKPVYRDCKHDPDTLRVLDAAIEGRQPTSPDKSELPETNGSWWRRVFRGDNDETGGGE